MFSFTRVSPAKKQPPCPVHGSSLNGSGGRRSPTRIFNTCRYGAKKKGRHQFKYLNKEFNLSNDPSFIIYAEIFIGYPVLLI